MGPAMKIDRIILENAFVRMEPLEERHREPLRAAAVDPDLWHFQLHNQHGGTHGGNFDTWFDFHLKENDKGTEVSWAALEKRSGQYAGSSSFINIFLQHRKLEIGNTWWAKPFWAGAVNPSCKRLMMAYAFDELNILRLEYKLDATNTRSFKAVERLGAKFEGIHRKHIILPDGRERDTAWFSVLRDEWPAVRDGLDKRLAAFA
jgi:RimJ/RimL family protein N-acetyltransferase